MYQKSTLIKWSIDIYWYLFTDILVICYSNSGIFKLDKIHTGYLDALGWRKGNGGGDSSLSASTDLDGFEASVMPNKIPSM